MSSSSPRRLPIAPLLELVTARYGELDDNGTLGIDDTVAAVYLNVNSDSLGRWRRRGWIGEPQADQATQALGEHPLAIWPAEWLADVDLAELELEEA